MSLKKCVKKSTKKQHLWPKENYIFNNKAYSYSHTKATKSKNASTRNVSKECAIMCVLSSTMKKHSIFI